MTLDEIEIGQEVICTSLKDSTSFESSTNRAIGHIGKVSSVFPMDEVVFIGHIEYDGENYREFLTAYYVDEISPYTPPERVLQNTINNLKNSLVD